ncbi:diguanylate cyclase [Paenibacillus thermotolerans]|uniref:diguanylate cyclase n=1 Tax=Paenibacillus thermotolerans TaxID=3027807 RepID=UPI002367EA5C|nr:MULTISPECIES: diguanylate cyclase [unclassified Paenibacillus]
MIATLIVDLAFYVAITLIWLKARDIIADRPVLGKEWISSLSVGLLSVLVMMQTFERDHLYFDLRFIPLLLYAYAKGWKAGLTACLLPIVYRLALGGDAAPEASFSTIVLPVFFGALFHNKSAVSEYTVYRWIDILVSSNLYLIGFWVSGIVFTDLPLREWTETALIMSAFGNISVIIMTWVFNDANRNRFIKKEYEKLANYDSKTGLPNIRFFHERAAALAAQQPIFLLMIDIDYFKHYNDSNGHIIGDGLLTHFGLAVKQSIGSRGFVARYGGEEFIAALPVDSKETACSIAEWVRSDIEKTSFSGGDKQPYGKLTVSIGVSGPANDLSTLIQQAEEALFVAKRQGKNRYCFYDDVAPFVDRTQLEQERDFFKNHYESILEASGDGICGLDHAGYVTFANPAAVRITGYKQDELVGKHIRLLFSKYAAVNAQGNDDSVPVNCPIERTLRDGVLRHQLDAPLYRKNDPPLSVEYICSPMIENGRVQGAVVTFIDITERKKMQELTRKADRMDVIGNTVEGIAHEIRNPLTTLKGFLQLSRSKLDPNHYETMRRELDQIDFVIRELLVVSKPYELQLQEVKLVDCIRESIESASSHAALQRTEIRFDYTREGLSVYGDAERLAQLVLHLIRNSLDSLEEDGVVSISLEEHAEDDSVLLSIQDNGKGMPENIVQKLGELFYSTKTNGIGLGLTLCNRIVQQHNGEMQITSAANQGTTVTVKLPSYANQAMHIMA